MVMVIVMVMSQYSTECLRNSFLLFIFMRTLFEIAIGLLLLLFQGSVSESRMMLCFLNLCSESMAFSFIHLGVNKDIYLPSKMYNLRANC